MGELYRKGFANKAAVRQKLADDFHHSDIVRRIKANDFSLEAGDFSLHMAREMGFCYGVERTVQYAYETLQQFPDANIYITDEIIHNPQVNEKLMSLGMEFLYGRYSCGKKIDDLQPSDIVLIPAFGVSVVEMGKLRDRGCILVDTTCGSVLNVWKNVERYARESVTAIVHGKYSHEETRATISQVTKYPQGKYLVVKDIPETHVVCEYIRHGGDAPTFLSRFTNSASADFDPVRDLARIGLANQTTMMCSESLEIQKLLREAMVERYGEPEISKRFIAFDTICSATQDRQDTLMALLRSTKLDLVLVVGGFNSSNTGHLAELGSEYAPTYHVENEQGLVSADEIRYRDPKSGSVVTAHGWLAPGKLAIGVTAGASTPDNIVGHVIERLLEIRGIAQDATAALPLAPSPTRA
ncbi:MAG TPA: 4-hydroxy-3-methylbut-2-enyl diphosphate reductase [Planctomycetota bacterium]|nr:4-hydroxy-3-methylbut-2-enyl diphosphate reductase [Planctomycetota bacterium]